MTSSSYFWQSLISYFSLGTYFVLWNYTQIIIYALKNCPSHKKTLFSWKWFILTEPFTLFSNEYGLFAEIKHSKEDLFVSFAW